MKPKSKFLLNPDHRDFIPRKSRLQFVSLGVGSWRECGCMVLLLLASIPMTIMLFSLVFGGILDYWHFEKEGIDIEVFVDSCQMTSGRSPVPELQYIYEVDEQIYAGTHKVYRTGGMRCGDYPEGTTLEAQYLLDNPEKSHITQADANTSWLMNIICLFPAMGLAIILFTVAPIVFVGWIIRYVLALRSYPLLRKKSILLEGEIIKAEREMRGEHKQFHYIKITYEFETPDGRLLTRSLSRQREDWKDKILPAAGTPVTVLYADDFAVIVL